MLKNEHSSQFQEMTILYVQEDSHTRLHYTKILKSLSPKVYVCTDTKDVLSEYAKVCPDLLIMDIGLEDSMEFQTLAQLREHDENLFILILSEHTQTHYLQKAIDFNVSSYLIEPVSKEQFVKAFEKIMQKCCKQKDQQSVYLDEDLYYQASIKALILEGEKVSLNKKEAKLLEYFLSYQNVLLTYAQIKKHIWPGLNVSSASLRTLVKNLRKKGMSERIQNISGSGYLLESSS